MKRSECHGRGLMAALGVAGAAARRRVRPYAGAALIAFGFGGGVDALAQKFEIAPGGGAPAVAERSLAGGDGGELQDGGAWLSANSDPYASDPTYAANNGGKGCGWGPLAPPPFSAERA